MKEEVDGDLKKYKNTARWLRKQTLLMSARAGSSHVGSCLSIADILSVLYERILNIDPDRPNWKNRDRFILSKGHAAAPLYAMLAKKGFFSEDKLQSYYLNDSDLHGHITHTDVPGVEASTGSLGHGLSIGSGMALSAKKDNNDYRTFALLSDGECDEGSTWEASLFASQQNLDNLTAIIDYNKIQACGRVEEVMDLDSLSDKFKSFGWSVKEIDGHNFSQIESSLVNTPLKENCPTCIIAHTVKGKGVSFMEDTVEWHYGFPDDEELEQALEELKE